MTSLTRMDIECAGLAWRAARSAFLLLALGMAACEAAEPPDRTGDLGEPEAPGATEAAMDETAECVNEADGYVIRYPASWEVNSGDIVPPCSLFDPEPIKIPLASEIPLDIAVIVGVEPVSFQRLSADVFGRRDLSREATTVGGRRAARIESETTGEGLYDRGVRFRHVVVDLGDRTLVAATYEVGPLPFDAKREILDQMLATIRFQTPN